MKIITIFCQVIAGVSAALIALSMMWVCLYIGFSGKAIGPPATLFIGMFGLYVAGSLWLAGSLLIRGKIF